MSRRKSITPKVRLNLVLPMDLRARMDLELVSELEGRVPLGKYADFIAARLREYFEWKSLDLSRFGFPADHFVRGPAHFIDKLEAALIYLHNSGRSA